MFPHGHFAVAEKMSLFLCLLLSISSTLVTAVIYQPCAVTDYACIGDYLASNSVCNPSVWGAIPPRYTIARSSFDAPYFNASFVDTNQAISNHQQCKVSKFFINLDTDRTVLSIRCTGLVINSTRTYTQHRPEAEDVVYNYQYAATYPLVIFTVNLQPSNYVNLCTSNSFAYLTSLPVVSIKAATVQTTNAVLALTPSIFQREFLYHRANLLMRYFINSFVCDFGCDF